MVFPFGLHIDHLVSCFSSVRLDQFLIVWIFSARRS